MRTLTLVLAAAGGVALLAPEAPANPFDGTLTLKSVVKPRRRRAIRDEDSRGASLTISQDEKQTTFQGVSPTITFPVRRAPGRRLVVKRPSSADAESFLASVQTFLDVSGFPFDATTARPSGFHRRSRSGTSVTSRIVVACKGTVPGEVTETPEDVPGTLKLTFLYSGTAQSE